MADVRGDLTQALDQRGGDSNERNELSSEELDSEEDDYSMIERSRRGNGIHPARRLGQPIFRRPPYNSDLSSSDEEDEVAVAPGTAQPEAVAQDCRSETSERYLLGVKVEESIDKENVGEELVESEGTTTAELVENLEVGDKLVDGSADGDVTSTEGDQAAHALDSVTVIEEDGASGVDTNQLIEDAQTFLDYLLKKASSWAIKSFDKEYPYIRESVSAKKLQGYVALKEMSLVDLDKAIRFLEHEHAQAGAKVILESQPKVRITPTRLRTEVSSSRRGYESDDDNDEALQASIEKSWETYTGLQNSQIVERQETRKTVSPGDMPPIRSVCSSSFLSLCESNTVDEDGSGGKRKSVVIQEHSDSGNWRQVGTYYEEDEEDEKSDDDYDKKCLAAASVARISHQPMIDTRRRLPVVTRYASLDECFEDLQIAQNNPGPSRLASYGSHVAHPIDVSGDNQPHSPPILHHSTVNYFAATFASTDSSPSDTVIGATEEDFVFPPENYCWLTPRNGSRVPHESQPHGPSDSSDED